MKICIIINELYLGGAQRLVVDDIREFQKRDIDISLITLRPQEGRITFESVCHLPADKRHEVFFSSPFDMPALMQLTSLIKREKYTVVITHLWLANTVGRIAARFAGVPTVFAFEQNVYDTVKSWKQFLLDRLLQGSTTRIIAISQAVKDSIVRHGINPKRIDILLNTIQPEDYQLPVDRNILRRELGLPEDAFLFITIGRLEKQKAHDILLKAFQKVTRGDLIIVGEGDLKDSLQKQTTTLGLDGKVFFLGVRKDIPALLNSSDCFVFPSRWEGVGIVMLEALAAGLPTIVSDFSAAKEIITNGSDGLIVPIENVEQLAEQMQRVLDSEQLRATLSKQAQITAQRFSIEEHVNTILKMIPQKP